ncbi:MAG: VanZ family protein [Vicinamibacterales bacterium]
MPAVLVGGHGATCGCVDRARFSTGKWVTDNSVDDDKSGSRQNDRRTDDEDGRSVTFYPRKETAVYRWALVALVIAIGYLALTPAPPPQLSLGWDKANHVLAFAALAFAGANGFRGARWHRIGLALGLVAYGAAIEIAQFFVPTRSCDWHDLLADIVGIGTGICISLVLEAGRQSSLVDRKRSLH